MPGYPSEIAAALADPGSRGVLPRGLGRSYGDVAQNAGGVVLDMTRLTGIRDLSGGGILTAAAGTSLDELLRAVVPLGWFLPVTPGTRFVTLGGAIANDIHGKNHHREGGFCDHLVSFRLTTPGGQERIVAPDVDPETFAATAGGLGLTGVITEVTLRLLAIQTSRVRVDTERASDLDDLMALMHEGDHRYRYSVAWVDCLARGRHAGRSVLTRGDHAPLDELSPAARQAPLDYRPRVLATVPKGAPTVISPATAKVFNELWFRKAPRAERGRIVPLVPFFHPLDALAGWNRLYGRRGFVQYQFVVPFGEEAVVRTTLERLSRARCTSLLAVLKRFGPGRGMLSFPVEGWTLALDIPAAQGALGPLLDGLDRLVASSGGRVYLAKDARLDPGLLRDMYPELTRWDEIRSGLDPGGALRSDLARRLFEPRLARRRVLA